MRLHLNTLNEYELTHYEQVPADENHNQEVQAGTCWLLRATPNLPTNITPTNIARLQLSGKFPMGLRIPPLQIKTTLESHPLKFHNVSRGIGRNASYVYIYIYIYIMYVHI